MQELLFNLLTATFKAPLSTSGVLAAQVPIQWEFATPTELKYGTRRLGGGGHITDVIRIYIKDNCSLLSSGDGNAPRAGRLRVLYLAGLLNKPSVYSVIENNL